MVEAMAMVGAGFLLGFAFRKKMAKIYRIRKRNRWRSAMKKAERRAKIAHRSASWEMIKEVVG